MIIVQLEPVNLLLETDEAAWLIRALENAKHVRHEPHGEWKVEPKPARAFMALQIFEPPAAPDPEQIFLVTSAYGQPFETPAFFEALGFYEAEIEAGRTNVSLTVKDSNGNIKDIM
jgi:hypothetical protein